MPELLLALSIVTAAVERVIAGRRHAAERATLIAIATAAQVSPASAAAAARPPAVREPADPRPIQAY